MWKADQCGVIGLLRSSQWKQKYLQREKLRRSMSPMEFWKGSELEASQALEDGIENGTKMGMPLVIDIKS